MIIHTYPAEYEFVDIELSEEESRAVETTLQLLQKLQDQNIALYDCHAEEVSDGLEQTDWFLEELLEGFIGDFELRKYFSN